MLNTIGGKEIIQLKNNCIHKGLVSLENIFNDDDVAGNPRVISDDNEVHECNIGKKKQPNRVKLSKFLSQKEKDNFVELMRKILDVFAWNYEYLKEYDTCIIQHTIPINPNENPFKKKLRRINPTPLQKNPVINVSFSFLFTIHCHF